VNQIPYDIPPNKSRLSIYRVNYKLRNIIKKLTKNDNNFRLSSARIKQLWEEIFFNSNSNVWCELYNRNELLHMMDSEPNSNAIWDLATVELLHQAIKTQD